MNSLQGKVVAVTGSARRIGRRVAVELADRGARVAVHYRRSAAAAAETAAECGGTAFRADLASVDQIRRLFDEIEQTYGRLDGLVNNAGVFRAVDPLEATERDWDSIHEVNLKGAFFCCQQGALAMLRSGGGRIVNVASLGGLRPWARHVPYCVSKAGVVMLTQALAKALAPDIAVNAVAPGMIEIDGVLPEGSPRLERVTPMGRHGSALDVSRAVCMLLEAPGFVTGQVLAVDGGLGLR